MDGLRGAAQGVAQGAASSAASGSPPTSNACAWGEGEHAQVRLEEDGTVTVLIGTQSTGQGHATAYAQFVAEQLGLRSIASASCRATPTRVRDRRRHRRLALDPGRRRLRRRAPRASSRSKLKELAADELEAGGRRYRARGRRGARRRAPTARSPSPSSRGAEARPRRRCTGAGEFEAAGGDLSRTARMSARSRSIPETGETEVVRYTIVRRFRRRP